MTKEITIAVASGKGGTGKTTFSVSLALAANEEVNLLDCDVEEPNCHIFLKPQLTEKEDVTVLIPDFDNDKCIKCGKCSRICRYNALIILPSGPMVFPELCHSCGGCALICPAGAVKEIKSPIGNLEKSKKDNVNLIKGELNVGKAMSPPVIRAVKEQRKSEILTIIDSPPGTSCPMISAVKGSDYIILVTEPTPFGLNDLKLAVETVRKLEIPFGVILNRCDSGDEEVDKYCAEEAIDIILKVPELRCISKAYSEGRIITEAVPELKDSLRKLLEKIRFYYGRKTYE